MICSFLFLNIMKELFFFLIPADANGTRMEVRKGKNKQLTLPQHLITSIKMVIAQNTQQMEEENISYPVTPVTIATPIIPMPVSPQTTLLPVVIPIHDLNNNNHRREEERRGSSHFRNRMILCLFAVAVNWGTTLRIANYFASKVILVPSINFVTQTCKTAYNITRDERLRYSKCVESQLSRCNQQLDRTILKEDERVRKLTKHNEEVVQGVEEVSTNCSSAYTSLRLAIEAWMANGGEIPIRRSDDVTNDGDAPLPPSSKESACSAEDQEQFNRTMLGTQNTLALQTEALKMANEYSEDSSSTVTRLASTISDRNTEISTLNTYIVERAEYDINYIDEKTQFIQDELYDIVLALDPGEFPPVNVDDIIDDLVASATDVMACVSLDENARMSDGIVCQPNLANMVDGFVEDAKWKVEYLTQTLYEYQDRMEEYKQNANDAYNVAKRFYDGAKAFINVARVVVFWENVGDWFDISDRDFFPIDVNFPNVDVAIENVGPFGSIDAMWGIIQPKISSFYASLALMPSRIMDRFGDAIENIMMDTSLSVFNLISRIVPDDYNPPKYAGSISSELNPKDEILLYKNKSEASCKHLCVLCCVVSLYT